VIKPYSEDALAPGRCRGRTGRVARMGTAQSTPRGLNPVKGRSIGLSYAKMTASFTEISVVDWILSRIRLITGRFLDRQ
jgi:hypothetical protein